MPESQGPAEQAPAQDTWWERINDAARRAQQERAAIDQALPRSAAYDYLRGTSAPVAPDPGSITDAAGLANFLAQVQAGHRQLDAAEQREVEQLQNDLIALINRGAAEGALEPLAPERLARLRAFAYAQDRAAQAQRERAGQRLGPIDITGLTNADWGGAARALPGAISDLLSAVGRWADESIPVNDPGLERRYAPTQPAHSPEEIRALQNGVQFEPEIVVTAERSPESAARGALSGFLELARAMAQGNVQQGAERLQQSAESRHPDAGALAIPLDVVRAAEDIWRNPARRGEQAMQERDLLRSQANQLDDPQMQGMADRAALEAMLPWLLDYPAILTTPEFALPGTTARVGAGVRNLGVGLAERLGAVGVTGYTPEQIARLQALVAEPQNQFRLPDEIVEVGGARPRVPFQAAEGEASGAGLIPADNPTLAERIGFLLRAGQSDRHYDVGRYMDTRRTGGPLPNGQPRTGEYRGVYSGEPQQRPTRLMSGFDPTDTGSRPPASNAPGGSTADAGAASGEQFVEAPSERSGIRQLGTPDERAYLQYYPAAPGRNFWVVDEALIEPSLRGQGLGVRLYEDLIARARAAGVPTIRSGASTSEAAGRVYQSLERRGYRVTTDEGPNGTRYYIDTKGAPATPSVGQSSEGTRPRLPDGSGAGQALTPSEINTLQHLPEQITGGRPVAEFSAQVRAAPVTDIPLAQIRREVEVFPDRLAAQRAMTGDPGPIMVRRNGDQFEILDGNHRVALALERGQTTIPARDVSQVFPVTNATESGAVAARASEAPSLAQRAGDWIKRTFGGSDESGNGGGMTLTAGVNPSRTVRQGVRAPNGRKDPALTEGMSLQERNALINSLREHYGRNPSGIGRWTGARPEGSAEHVAQILRGEAPLPDGTFVPRPIPNATASVVKGVWKRTEDARRSSAPSAEQQIDPYFVEMGQRLGISPERARALSARSGGVASDSPATPQAGKRTDLPTMGYHATVRNVQGPLQEGMGSLGRGVYHSRDPRIAERFVANELGEFPEGANIVPERLPALDRYVALDRVEDDLFRLATARGANMDDPAAIMRLQDELKGYYQRRGFVGIHDPAYKDGLGQMVTWDASNRRAPWARMDESARHSSDPLSAGIDPTRIAQFLRSRAPRQSAQEIEEAKRILRETPAPQTLTQWVRRQGGVLDDRGDVASIEDAARGFGRLTNRTSGRYLDDLTRAAWEEGYFPDHVEPPTQREFIDALRGDFSGRNPVVADETSAALRSQAQSLLDAAAEAGIDPSLRGMRLISAVRNRTMQPMQVGVDAPQVAGDGRLFGGVDPTRTGAQAEAPPNAPATLNIPDDPAQWRELVGQHPWINSPARAQLIIMDQARTAEGARRFSRADIANVTGYTEASQPVVMNQARAEGVNAPPTSRRGAGAYVPEGGATVRRILDMMEAAARNGARLTRKQIAERLGGTSSEKGVNVILSRLRRGHMRQPELEQRLRDLEARAGTGGDLQTILPWLATGGYFTALSTVANQGFKSEDPSVAAATRYTQRNTESQPAQ